MVNVDAAVGGAEGNLPGQTTTTCGTLHLFLSRPPTATLSRAHARNTRNLEKGVEDETSACLPALRDGTRQRSRLLPAEGLLVRGGILYDPWVELCDEQASPRGIKAAWKAPTWVQKSMKEKWASYGDGRCIMKRSNPPSHFESLSLISDNVEIEDILGSSDGESTMSNTSSESRSMPMSNATSSQGVSSSGQSSLLPSLCGNRARARFFRGYHKLAKRLDAQFHTSTDQQNDDVTLAVKPQEIFLRYLVSQQCSPVPAILRKASNPYELNLSHRGVGDIIGKALAAVLPQLEGLTSLKIRDNRLTDESLTPMLLGLWKVPHLVELDLSENDIDEAAGALRKYLSSTSCTLQRLYMSAADVDDNECADMMAALETNTSLLHLDLSANLIGEKETYNSVFPDYITGGEGIAQMLDTNTSMTNLDVSWNSIRLESAVALGKAVRDCCLIHLNVSHNSLGKDGGLWLAHSLRRNATLKTLDISYNGLPPVVAMVIANALLDNKTLGKLDISHNTLARQGAKMLLATLRYRGGSNSPLFINMQGGELNLDASDLLNAFCPTGQYTLDLSDPYDYMAARVVLDVVNRWPSATMSNIYWSRTGNKQNGGSSAQRIELQRLKSNRRNTAAWISPAEYMLRGIFKAPDSVNLSVGANQVESMLRGMGMSPSKHVLEQITQTFAQTLLREAEGEKLNKTEDNAATVTVREVQDAHDVAFFLFECVFKVCDSDNSGFIDHKELLYLLKELGCSVSPEEALHRALEYDIDRSGTIELPEFEDFMSSEFLSGIGTTDQAPATLLALAGSQQAWKVPEEGILKCSVEADNIMPPGETGWGGLNDKETAAESSIPALISNIQLSAKNATDCLSLFRLALEGTDFFLSSIEGQKVIKLWGKGLDRVDMMEALMPQMCSARDAITLVENNTNFLQRLELRKRLGPAWGPLTGNPTGFYSLDLNVKNDRLAAMRLGMLNAREYAYSRQSSGRKDTSQKGNWCNFRSETLNGEPIKLTSAWFADMPHQGKLRFDYVGTTPPKKNAKPMSERRFARLLFMLDFPTSEDQSTLLGGEEGDNDAPLPHREAYQAVTSGKVQPIGPDQVLNTFREFFLTSKAERRRAWEVAELGRTVHSDEEEDARRTLSASQGPRESLEHKSHDVSEVCASEMGSFNEADDSIPNEAATVDLASSIPAGGEGTTDELRPASYERQRSLFGVKLKHRQKKPRPSQTSSYTSSWHKLCCIQVMLLRQLITATQAKQLIGNFPSSDAIRVIVATFLFNRLVDFGEVDSLLDVLSEEDESELQWRLGPLNVINPLRIERYFDLDLTSYEDRQLCKMLVHLAVEEPGENWQQEEYRWSQHGAPVPGWVLPLSWTTPDDGTEGGPRRFGRLSLRYTSDRELGCAKKPLVRKELLSCVLAGSVRPVCSG